MAISGIPFTPDHDEYDTAINSDHTYKAIASWLVLGPNIIIAWTDQRGSQFDILFSFRALPDGPLQGGIKPNNDLFVSIMRKGAFAFSLDRQSAPGYYGEKLNMSQEGVTIEALADLLNGVRRELAAAVAERKEWDEKHKATTE